MTVLVLIAAALLLGAALWLVLFRENLLAALWHRLFNDPEPYHPLFAEAPDDGYERSKYFTGEEAAQLEAAAQPAVPIVASDHPSDCGDACCWEIRLTEMHDSFDWHAAEHEMRSKR